MCSCSPCHWTSIISFIPNWTSLPSSCLNWFIVSTASRFSLHIPLFSLYSYTLKTEAIRTLPTTIILPVATKTFFLLSSPISPSPSSPYQYCISKKHYRRLYRASYRFQSRASPCIFCCFSLSYTSNRWHHPRSRNPLHYPWRQFWYKTIFLSSILRRGIPWDGSYHGQQ